jgi:hypothetical protein
MVFTVAALQACATGWGGRGVQLPQGDAVKGREAFVHLRCHACHEIEGFAPTTPIVAATRVMLGGRTGRIKTYGDLVTSIANPSHRIAEGYPPGTVTVDGVPLMTRIRLNEVMTVQQLIDVAAFLQTVYEVAPPPIGLDDAYPSADADTRALSPTPAL